MFSIHEVCPFIAPGHQLDYQYVDDECNDLKGPGKIVELRYRNNYSALIGPACSQVQFPVHSTPFLTWQGQHIVIFRSMHSALVCLLWREL